MNPRRILSQIALVAGALLLSAGVQTFAAFTAPTTAPPGVDAYAPLHTGSARSQKSTAYSSIPAARRTVSSYRVGT